jgi:hypothetical protein
MGRIRGLAEQELSQDEQDKSVYRMGRIRKG